MHDNILANKFGALGFALVEASQPPDDLSSSSVSALMTLHHWGELPVTKLSAIVGLTQPATTRMLTSLKEAGLVSDGKVDGRLRPAALTQKGKRKAATLSKAREEALTSLLAPLNKSERTSMDTMLSKILSGVVDSRETARRLCRQCDHGICTGSACPIGTEATRLERRL